MFSRLFIIFFSLFIGLFSLAQKNTLPPDMELDSLQKYENILRPLGDSVRDGINEFERMDALTDFIPIFVRALKFRGSYFYPFDSLTFMHKLTAPDNTFRLYNWVLKFDDGTYRYYCALHFNDPDKLRLIPFYDQSNKIPHDVAEDTLLNPECWFGVQYYDIFSYRYKKQSYYILFGWDGNNSISHKKVIEVMYFKDGKVFFGAPFFKDDKSIKNRVIFQYTSNAIVSLKYHKDKKLIVFDHLVAPNEKSEGKKWLYVPDGSYDYYKMKKGKFVFGIDVFSKYKINTGL